MKGFKTYKIDFCEHCVLGKQSRMKFGTTIHQNNETFDYVDSDNWGTTKVVSFGGKYWFISFGDDYSFRAWIYIMKDKFDIFNVFIN